MMIKSSILAVALFTAAYGSAQSVPPTVTVKLDKPKATAGTTVNATLKVKFAPGLHGYQNPPTDKFQIPISVSAGKGTTISKVTYPKGVMKKSGGDTTQSAVYEGEITITVALKAPSGAGVHDVNLVLNYQQCTNENCYPPDKVPVKTTITVVK